MSRGCCCESCRTPPRPTRRKSGVCVYLVSPPSAAAARARFAERLADFSAREGRQTLLVDADLSAASHADRGGLREVLRGEQSVSDLAYIETDDRFSRLAKGAADPEDWRPRENNDAFRLRRMRRCYDLVILDGGSMTENDRLSALASQCDLVALVAEIGRASIRSPGRGGGCGVGAERNSTRSFSSIRPTRPET